MIAEAAAFTAMWKDLVCRMAATASCEEQMVAIMRDADR